MCTRWLCGWVSVLGCVHLVALWMGQCVRVCVPGGFVDGSVDVWMEKSQRI